MWRVVTKENNKIVVWATGHDINRLYQFVQYTVDSMADPSKFYVQDLGCSKEIKLDYFAEFYRISKRTFEERMSSPI